MNAISDTVMTLAVVGPVRRGRIADPQRRPHPPQGKRPDRRAGGRAAQARRRGRRVPRRPGDRPASIGASFAERGSPPTTTIAWPCRSPWPVCESRRDDPRPRLRRQDLPRLLGGSERLRSAAMCRSTMAAGMRPRATNRRRASPDGIPTRSVGTSVNAYALSRLEFGMHAIDLHSWCRLLGCSEPQFIAGDKAPVVRASGPAAYTRCLIAWRAGTPAPLPAQLLGISARDHRSIARLGRLAGFDHRHLFEPRRFERLDPFGGRADEDGGGAGVSSTSLRPRSGPRT